MDAPSSPLSMDVSSPFPRIARAVATFGGSIANLVARYPRLLTAVEGSWGTPACLDHIDDLLLSDRSGRQGFPREILDELLSIKNAFQSQFPDLAGSPHDPFLKAAHANIVIGPGPTLSAEPPPPPVAKPAPPPATGKPRATAAPVGQTLKADDLCSQSRLREALARLDSGIVPTGAERKLLGAYLVAAGAIDEKSLAGALTERDKIKNRPRIGDFLRASHAVTAAQVNRALCRQRGIPVVDAASIDAAPEAIRLVPLRIARQKEAMPLALHDQRLVVAVENPFDEDLAQFFSFLSGGRAILVFASRESILAAQASYGQLAAANGGGDAANGKPTAPSGGLLYADSAGEDNDASDEDFDAGGTLNENDETVIGLVNKVINDAIRLGASDVHFEAFPRTRSAQIRIRRDGQLEHYSEYPLSYHPAVISRLKILAEIDIAEKRKGQDGKISFGQGNRKRDLRLSTIPTTNALETATLRILSSGGPLPLDKLEIAPTVLAAFRHEIIKPYGLILACGPTGSGKTTTLHSVLHELNTPERKIWTAEDPVEVVQRNISQVQVKPKIGWTFAHALRSFLRADPDVIMIGEIRDDETAKVAVEASMTGHLVLSTLHTNSAPETLARLIDLGVAPFNLADAALAILAQRLARRVCADCGVPRELQSDELESMVSEYMLAAPRGAPSRAERDRLLSSWRQEFAKGGPLTTNHGSGCPACNGTGYRGRIGIHELLVVTPQIRRVIREGASTGSLFAQAIADGMKTLRQDGIEKVLKGFTDMAEVRAVCL